MKANPKDKKGDEKWSPALVPSSFLKPLSEVMKLGAAKYSSWNWRTTNPKRMVYLNAMLRHIHADLDGETTDKESGQPHIAHACACALIILDAEKHGTLVDDRNKPIKRRRLCKASIKKAS